MGQLAAKVVMSSLVLFLRQTLTLTNYMIYCFTLFGTKPTKRGDGLVYVELNIVICSQCLLLLYIIIIIIIVIIIFGTLSRTDAFCACPQFKRPFVLGLKFSLD